PACLPCCCSSHSQRNRTSLSGLGGDDRLHRGMVANDPPETKTPLHTPEWMFVIHLRSDSAVARRHLVGRVEHVMSGESEPFASLDALLAFMARFTDAGAPAESTGTERKGGTPMKQQ